MNKNVSDQYQLLSEKEHVLHRPGMYIGSTTWQISEENILTEDGFIKEEVKYIPGFLKLFDEIVSNSVDEHKRHGNITWISVKIDTEKGSLSVYDNGGIPVQKHNEHKIWIPELIFNKLRSGSNFDDTQDRNVAGTNGVGATLTNIFSKSFRIETSDGKKKFDQTFTDNSQKTNGAKISKSSKGFTRITYIPDYDYFKMKGIDEDHINLIKKRIVDISACNPKLKLEFIVDGEKDKFQFKKFQDYVSLYVPDGIVEEDDKWSIGVGCSTQGYQNTSFVNSVHTKDGGTHVDYITSQIVDELRTILNKKHKVQLKPSDIRNHLHIFVRCDIKNSSFSSQTKEKLITSYKNFGSEFSVSSRFIKQILKSEIIQTVLDWIEKKNAAEERSKLRRLNKNLSAKILKLIDAKSKTDREQCSLGIFEGDSAIGAVRKFRDPQLFGAFPLKGKSIPNVLEKKDTSVAANKEVQGIMGALGLKLGEEAFNELPKSGKIIKIQTSDGKILEFDETEELFINGEWISVKDLSNKK